MAEDNESLVRSESTSICEDNIVSDYEVNRSSDLTSFSPYDDITTPSECFEIDVFHSAPPLKDLYRYHIFFSHSQEDTEWISGIVNRLESAPYNYKCHYIDNMMDTKQNVLRSLMCAVILSERVVITLTPLYVKSNWNEFQEILQNLTVSSLHQQRILVVLLKDCNIPEQLQTLGFLDARESDFFECLLRHLRSERLPRSSESFSSEMSCILYKPLSEENGQILTTAHICFRGCWKASLQCIEEEDVPTSLSCHGIGMNNCRYAEIINSMTTTHNSKHSFFLFSFRPFAILIACVIVWLAVFSVVLVYMVDDSEQGIDIIGLRLTVFAMPIAFVTYVYFIRWKRQRIRYSILCNMIYQCVVINEELYHRDMPLLLTPTLTNSGVFNIHFIYFSLTECIRDVELLLKDFGDGDFDRFRVLVNLYTSSEFMTYATLAERICVMTSSIYLHRLLLHDLPLSPQQRHVDLKLCLCQYIEQVLENFYQCLSSTSVVSDLVKFFREYFVYHIKRTSVESVKNNLILEQELTFLSL